MMNKMEYGKKIIMFIIATNLKPKLNIVNT